MRRLPGGPDTNEATLMIGIRREDKSKWEARTPLTPEDIRQLIKNHGLRFQVQASPIRAFSDDAYRATGAAVVGNLRDCPIILGIKEIPIGGLEPGKTYVFFSHTIKLQPANMPMLRRIVELGCTLIDYERIVDEQGRRLVFFGRYAGLAGMIDTLWALGQRLQHEGVENPFALVRHAYEYDDLQQAKGEIRQVGERIRKDGLPAAIQPFVCGFAGYGNVSRGAQEIFDLLPVCEIPAHELAGASPSRRECYKVVFREEHLAERVDGGSFGLQDYYDHPENYRSKFFPYLRHLTVLVNCIYWEPKYPRLVTNGQLRELFSGHGRSRLRVIGDITCDINGSIECTVRATEPDDPVYVFEPESGRVQSGVAGDGPVILAVDILPCELPVDASAQFGKLLSPLIPALARANLGGALGESGLPPALQRATIVYKGELTGPYRYLEAEIR
ncbi:MAG: bifunctional lysine ketoglutarate reductase /saccharopine dehydrogenase family protein [Phycisphaerae bacterium]